MGIFENALAADKRDLIPFDQAFNAANKAGNNLIFPRGDLCIVEGHILGKYAIFSGFLCIAIKLGGMDEGFGGDAAAVQAGAACLALFHNGGLEAQLRCAQCRFIAAGTCATRPIRINYIIKYGFCKSVLTYCRN